MKFTNGYWLLRDEMKAAYAVEYGSHRTDDVSAVFPYRGSGKLSEYPASDGDSVQYDGRCDQSVCGAS